MLMGTPEGKIADLRKQKEAAMYLSSEYDEEDMAYYAVLFKRTMELDISAAASAIQQTARWTESRNGARKGGS